MNGFRRFGASASCLLLAAVAALGCSQEVKIGAIISETGGVGPYGTNVMRGIDLALEQINAEGGFQGSAIQIVYRNDASNPETGVEVVQDLIENEGVDLIIGAIASGVTLRIAPICERNGVVLLSPSSSAPPISGAGEYIFRNYPSDILEGTAMADFARELGLKRVLIVALNTAFGDGLTEIFTKRFESKTRTVVDTLRFDEADPAAFDEMAGRIAELQPEGIYLVAYVNEMKELLQRLHASELSAVVMASASVTDSLIRTAGAAAENLVYPQPAFDTETKDPAVTDFVEAYRAKYRDDPDIYAAHGYDAMKLLWTAMNDTGSAHPDDVRRGLLGIDGYEGAAGRTAFDENGDVVRYPQVFVVQGGKSVQYEQFARDGGRLPAVARR